MQFRKLHRWVGLVTAVWILNAAFTGVMRANATTIYWKNRPSTEKPLFLSVPAVDVAELYAILGQVTDELPVKLKQLELTSLLGRMVYRVQMSSQQANVELLVDAGSGEVLSPLSEETALSIARTYVRENVQVKKTEFLEVYHARKSETHRPVYRFLFDDPEATEIFVDRDTGKVLTVLDRGRRFGLWMIKLHELDFAGWRQPGLTILGVATIFISITGLTLLPFWRRESKNNRSES